MNKLSKKEINNIKSIKLHHYSTLLGRITQIIELNNSFGKRKKAFKLIKEAYIQCQREMENNKTENFCKKIF